MRISISGRIATYAIALVFVSGYGAASAASALTATPAVAASAVGQTMVSPQNTPWG